MEDTTVQCDICLRPSTSRLPFNCTLCARSLLYEPRIQLAQTLLENETLTREVERGIGTTKPDLKPAHVIKSNQQESSPKWLLEQIQMEQAALKGRSEHILSHTEALRRETEEMRVEIAQKKAKLLRRRSDLKSATDGLSQREAIDIEPLERAVRKMEHRWDAMHAKSRESRVFLCREAAQLYGLQQRKRKKGSTGKELYLIGGMPIANLRDLNNASPAQVTNSTTNLAHLVHLVSHYLSLRLPAEITLPHRDYPLPTIFSPGSSYTFREVPYPGFTPLHSSNNSPSASRIADQRSLPRPRPLHLDRKLPALAKEDPVAYALFVEGITLLAWNIAWLCKTQGLNVGDSSWEEVCAMGKNLWQLLVVPPLPAASQSPQGMPISESPSKQPQTQNPTARHESPPKETEPWPVTLGHFSHGTAHSFLAAAGGTDHMRGWRLQSPVKVIEKVKAMLLSERTGAEWEILEGNEWEEEAGIGHTENGEGRQEEGTVDGVEGESKGKGASGWMKVKSRTGT